MKFLIYSLALGSILFALSPNELPASCLDLNVSVECECPEPIVAGVALWRRKRRTCHWEKQGECYGRCVFEKVIAGRRHVETVFCDDSTGTCDCLHNKPAGYELRDSSKTCHAPYEDTCVGNCWFIPKGPPPPGMGNTNMRKTLCVDVDVE